MTETVNFKTLADEWLQKKADSVKKSTFFNYQLQVRKHLIPALGERTDIDERRAQALVDEAHAAGLSRKTLIDMIAVLRQMLRYGRKMYGLPEPDWAVVYPRSHVRRLPVLPKEDHRRLLRELTENPTPANIGVLLALATGMRIGEVTGLRWDDVDFRTATIQIARTAMRIYDVEARRTVVFEGLPKTRSSERTIPMSRDLKVALRAVRKAEDKAAVYVVGGRATAKEPRGYRDYYYRLLRRLRIKPIVFHGLRHSFATRAIESGVDVKTVSSILGHSNVAVTMNLYVHPTDDQKRRCLERLSTFINSKKRKLC